MWNADFDRWVGEYKQFGAQNKDVSTSGGELIDRDIGRSVEFNRIAVHHVVLPPGDQTSRPHAESLEEEFVYVLSGTPHVWIDGYVYPLMPGHAVGFPAGTGIAHTLINNSATEVHLLVAGEKTKKENLCYFPLNPELKSTNPIWWNDAPSRPLGPHNGLPGPVRENEIGRSPPECIVYCPEVPGGKGFHYPGDNETFGQGFRITDKVGLKALGIWYEHLPPGRRSAFPHAHTHEEEFVYTLIGTPTIWMNGYTKTLSPGDIAAFPSNTGIAHTLINDSDTSVIYMCIGETEEFAGERIHYPLNPLRNKECARKKWHWDDCPKFALGPHKGVPHAQIPEHLRFKLLAVNDSLQVLDLFQHSTEYFIRVDGCPPTLESTQRAIVDQPPKTGTGYFKEFLGIEYCGELVGVADLHLNHPEQGICYLGLLLIADRYKGRGLGRAAYLLIEDYVKRACQCTSIRLGISSANDVSGFWTKLSYKSNGRSYPWKGEKITAIVDEYEKALELS